MGLRALAFAAGLASTIALPGAAHTSELVTTGAVNMRTGAGVDHRRIATLPPGASMAVERCDEGWCLGDVLGLRGWVSARYLSGDTGPQIDSYAAPLITVPSMPAVKFPFVMPDRGFHDYGHGSAHKFERPNK